MSGFAWVTLATNDSYSLGALVLAHSLKQVGTAHQLVVLVTPGVTNVMRKNLAVVFDVVEEVNLFDSKDEANLRLLKRPELGVTFTKLHCWRLTQFEKCVFLDADVLVLVNADELFEREEFSAAPDVGWPDCFNSGVFVYRPSTETYNKLVDFAVQTGSFDGGDQGLLNAFFSDWAHKDISKHLPFIYNMCSTACYSYLPAFKYYGSNVKIVHFIGTSKPWLQYFDTETRKVHPSSDLQHLEDVLQKWWDFFCSLIHPQLTPDMAASRQNAESHYPQSHHYPHQYTSHFQNSQAHFEDQRDQSTNDVYNVWDPWEEYERREETIASSGDHMEYKSYEDVSARDEYTSSSNHGVSIVNNCDTLPNVSDLYRVNTREIVPEIYNTPTAHNVFDDRPLESSHTHETLKENVAENIFSVTTTNIQNKTECQTTNDNASISDRLDNLRIPDEHQKITSSSDNNSHPIPMPHAQVHNLTELSLPNVPETSANNFEDASCSHTKVYDDELEQGGLAGAFASFTLGVKRSASQDALEDHLRRQSWEVGNIDYMGRDSFDNIWSKICETLSATRIDDGEPPQAAAAEPLQPAAVEPLQPAAVEPPKPVEEITAEIPQTEAKQEVLPTTLTASVESPTAIEAAPVEEVVSESQPVEQVASESEPVAQQEVVPPDVVPQPEPVQETPETVATQEAVSQVPVEIDPTATRELQQPEAPEVVEQSKVEPQAEIAAASRDQPAPPTNESEPEVPKEQPKAEPLPEVTAPPGEAKVEPQPEVTAPIETAELQSKVTAPIETAEPQSEVTTSIDTAESKPKVTVPQEEFDVEPVTETAAPKEELKSEVSSPKDEATVEPVTETGAPNEELKSKPEVLSSPIEVKPAVPQTEVVPQQVASAPKAEEVPLPKEEAKVEQKPIPPTENIVEEPAREPVAAAKEAVAPSVPPQKKPTEKKVEPAKEEAKQVKPKPPKLDTTTTAKAEAKVEVATKSESPKSPVSPKEEVLPEGSSQTPKSETKPKEVKKIKKKVKKVPKAEAGDSSDAKK